VAVESEALKVDVERPGGTARPPRAGVAEDVLTRGPEGIEGVLELGMMLESISSPAADEAGEGDAVGFWVVEVEVEELDATAGGESWALTPEITAKIRTAAIHKIDFLKRNTHSNSLIEKSRYYNK